MNVLASKHIELPIEGMTCAACAARIEKNLNKLPGVKAAVNFASEKATITFDEMTTPPQTLIHSIEKTGFNVVPHSVQLQISGMTCAACSSRIEKALTKMAGVTANINLATEIANVTFIPGTTTVGDLIVAVEKAGYGATVMNAVNRIEEKARRLAAYQAEFRMFLISAALTLPFMLQMGVMLSGDHTDLLPRWLQWLLATPIQFWVGRRFYSGAWHALRVVSEPRRGSLDISITLPDSESPRTPLHLHILLQVGFHPSTSTRSRWTPLRSPLHQQANVLLGVR